MINAIFWTLVVVLLALYVLSKAHKKTYADGYYDAMEMAERDGIPLDVIRHSVIGGDEYERGMLDYCEGQNERQ